MHKRRRHFGSVFKRTGKPGYYIRWIHQGRMHERKGGSKRSIACTKLSQIELMLETGASTDEVLAEVFGDRSLSTTTFRELSPEYMKHARLRKRPSTVEVDQQRLDIVCKAKWTATPLAEVTSPRLQAWADDMRAAGRSGSTVNRYLCVLSAVFSWACRRGYCKENPVRGVERFEEPEGREVYLNPEEVRELITQADDDIRPFLIIAIGTGARRGELLTLCWKDVDLDAGRIVIRSENAKTKRSRAIPISPVVREALLELRQRSGIKKLDGSDPVMVRVNGRPFKKEWLRCRFAKAKANCTNIPAHKRDSLRLHDLRHTAASLMVAESVPIFDVSKILGHADVRMSMRYAHFAPDAGRAAVTALGNAMGLDSPPASASEAS